MTGTSEKTESASKIAIPWRQVPAIRLPAGSRQFLRWAIALSLLLFVFCMAIDFHRAPSNTFSIYYFAGKAAASGQDIYQSRPPGDQKFEYVYPPFFAAAMIPLTYLKIEVAARLWLGLSIAIVFLTLGLASMRILKSYSIHPSNSTVFGVAALALLMGLGEVKTELATGQTDTLVLLSFVAALCLLEQSPILAGMALGLGANIKYQTLIAIPYLLIRRQWKAAISACASTAFFALLPSLVFGFSRNAQYLLRALGGLGRFANISSVHAASTVPLTWIRSVSITSAVGRMLEIAGHDPGHAVALSAVLALLILAGTYLLYKKNRLSLFGPTVRDRAAGLLPSNLTSVEWAGLAVAWLIFGPEVSRRHMYALLLLDVIAAVLIFAPSSREWRTRLLIGAAVFQLGLRLPPSGGYFENLSFLWNWIAGPSWCLVAFYFVVLAACLAAAGAARGRSLAGRISEPQRTSGWKKYTVPPPATSSPVLV
jgi:hypothetical protein